MTEKSEIKKSKMNESGTTGGAGSSNSGVSAKPETGKDLSAKVGVNVNINAGGNGKPPGDNGSVDVGPEILLSTSVVNNVGHQHHHHHHHHTHNHQHHQQHHQQQQLQQNLHQQQQQQSVIINNGGFYDQKSDICSAAQTEEDDGLGPLPSKWEKAYTDSGEVYFIELNNRFGFG